MTPGTPLGATRAAEPACDDEPRASAEERDRWAALAVALAAAPPPPVVLPRGTTPDRPEAPAAQRAELSAAPSADATRDRFAVTVEVERVGTVDVTVHRDGAELSVVVAVPDAAALAALAPDRAELERLLARAGVSGAQVKLVTAGTDLEARPPITRFPSRTGTGPEREAADARRRRGRRLDVTG